jgi:hypothetical protein
MDRDPYKTRDEIIKQDHELIKGSVVAPKGSGSRKKS